MIVRLLSLVMLVGVMLLAVGCGSTPESTLAYSDVQALTGDAARGAVLYNEPQQNLPTCVSCHIVGTEAGAPSLTGYAALAGERVPDMDAHEYTFYAIAEPARHIVTGYGNAMFNGYDDALSAQDIADLIAYLLQTE